MPHLRQGRDLGDEQDVPLQHLSAVHILAHFYLPLVPWEQLQNRGSFYSAINVKKILLVSVQFGAKSMSKKEFLTNLLLAVSSERHSP